MAVESHQGRAKTVFVIIVFGITNISEAYIRNETFDLGS